MQLGFELKVVNDRLTVIIGDMIVVGVCSGDMIR